jgi:hypothetical protein
MSRRATPSVPLLLAAVTALIVLLVPSAAAGAAAGDPPRAVTVSVPDEINLATPGLVPVTVRGSDHLDVHDLDLGALEVAGAGVARHDDGGRVTWVADTDGDGHDDLVVFVDKDDLTAAGQLDADTSTLGVSATTTDGAAVAGRDDTATTVTLEVRFDDAAVAAGAAPRDGGAAVAQVADAVPAVRAALDRQGGAEVEPLFDAGTLRRLDATEPAVAATELGQPVPDLGAWAHVTLPADADIEVVLAELEALDEVVYAYPAPEPVPPPQAFETDTPDFTHLQGYFGPAPTGIDADLTRQDPRLRGAGITIANLEYDWNEHHEDLRIEHETDLGGGEFLRFTGFGPDHGTAVFGQLVARDNDFGVTGGVPDAQMYGISPTRAPNNSWQPGPALAYLASLGVLEAGDVVLLEQQTASPLGGTRYAPLEWVPSVYEANVVLASQGVNVVSTGGNGNTATDDPMYTRDGQPWFDREVRDSGAIYVGAGSSTTRERLNFSNYGPRFDLQAWGQNITTTGYCTLYCIPDDPDVRYTNSFSGTSGAGPIVTAAVVAVQSYLRATDQDPMTAPEVAELLIETGTPQGPTTAAQHIGPLPDLRAALVSIEVDAPETEATVTAANSGAPPQRRLVRPVVTLDADDGWGSGVVRTEYRVDGGPWRTYTEPIRVDGNGPRTVEYRSIDANGNVEQTRAVSFFALGRHGG